MDTTPEVTSVEAEENVAAAPIFELDRTEEQPTVMRKQGCMN